MLTRERQQTAEELEYVMSSLGRRYVPTPVANGGNAVSSSYYVVLCGCVYSFFLHLDQQNYAHCTRRFKLVNLTGVQVFIPMFFYY